MPFERIEIGSERFFFPFVWMNGKENEKKNKQIM